MNKRVKIYYREILETGDIEEMLFNESHIKEASDIHGSIFDFRDGIQLLGALTLINKWNNSGCKYKYWI